MDWTTVLLAVFVPVTAIFTFLNSVLNILNRARSVKNAENLHEISISVDGKWTELAAQNAAYLTELIALRAELKDVLSRSVLAEGVLAGKAEEKANPT